MPEIMHYNFLSKQMKFQGKAEKCQWLVRESYLKGAVLVLSLRSSLGLTWISKEVALQTWHLNISFIGWESLNYYEIPLKDKSVFNTQMKEGSEFLGHKLNRIVVNIIVKTLQIYTFRYHNHIR